MFRKCSALNCYHLLNNCSLQKYVLGEGDNQLRRIVGSIVLLMGVALVFYPQIEKKWVYDREQQLLIDSFEELGRTEYLQQLSTEAESRIHGKDVDRLKKSIVANSTQDKKQETLEGARAILRIDRIELEMIVFDGAGAVNLSKGAGVIEPKKQFGIDNVGVAGHRALVKGKQFNRLDELAPNDVIEVTTRDGAFQYEITRKFVVPKTDVSVLNDTDTPLLTLVTCTPIGKSNPPDRLIVQAELKK